MIFKLDTQKMISEPQAEIEEKTKLITVMFGLYFKGISSYLMTQTFSLQNVIRPSMFLTLFLKVVSW